MCVCVCVCVWQNSKVKLVKALTNTKFNVGKKGE